MIAAFENVRVVCQKWQAHPLPFSNTCVVTAASMMSCYFLQRRRRDLLQDGVTPWPLPKRLVPSFSLALSSVPPPSMRPRASLSRPRPDRLLDKRIKRVSLYLFSLCVAPSVLKNDFCGRRPHLLFLFAALPSSPPRENRINQPLLCSACRSESESEPRAASASASSTRPK